VGSPDPVATPTGGAEEVSQTRTHETHEQGPMNSKPEASDFPNRNLREIALWLIDLLSVFVAGEQAP